MSRAMAVSVTRKMDYKPEGFTDWSLGCAVAKEVGPKLHMSINYTCTYEENGALVSLHGLKAVSCQGPVGKTNQQLIDYQ